MKQSCLFILLAIILVLTATCGKNEKTATAPVLNGAIIGTIRNAEDNSPIDSARVETQPGGYSCFSDTLGVYRLTEIPENQYVVWTYKEKFHSDTISVIVESGQTVTADFDLDPVFDPLKWQCVIDEPVYYSTPAINADGTIYVGTGRYLGTTSGSLYAIYPGGAVKWQIKFSHNANSAAIGQDGTIYVLDRGNVLYAIDPSGREKWRYDEWDNVDFAEVGQRVAAIASDQTLYIYVASSLYAINPDGTRKWVYSPGTGGNPCGASPVIGRDGTIYAVLGQEVLHAVHPDGTCKWEFYFQNYSEHSYTSPALDEHDVIYFGTEDGYGGHVYAVYPDGILKWRISTGSGKQVRASPAIDVDGTVYVATKAYSHRQPAELLAVSPAGRIKWKYIMESVHFTPDDAYSTPAIGADGLIYVAAETGFIYALNRDGTLNWKMDFHCGINWSSPTLLEDGTLYIGTMMDGGGSILSLQTQSMGYAPSAWPAFRQNNRNTGRYDHY